MNRAAGTERGSVSRSTSPCKPSCCGSQTRAPRSGSWRASFRFFACIGTMDHGVSCQAAEPSSRATRCLPGRSFCLPAVALAEVGAKADEVRVPFHSTFDVRCSMFDVPWFMEYPLSTFRLHWNHEPGRDALPRVRLPLLPLPAKRGEGRGEGFVFCLLSLDVRCWMFDVGCFRFMERAGACQP